MESQKLQGDNAQNSLQTVHRVRDFDGPLVVLDGFNIFLVANHYWPPLERRRVLLGEKARVEGKERQYS